MPVAIHSNDVKQLKYLGYKVELIESLGKITVFTMVLLSVFLLTVKAKNKLSNRLFGLYLLVIAFDLIGFFTAKTLEYPIIHHAKTASSLLQLPLFYLYVLSACYTNFKIEKKHSLHFILFVVFFLVFLVAPSFGLVFQIYGVVGEIQYIAYIIAIFRVLRKYKTVYLENYSNVKHTIYQWLFQITVLSCIGHTFVLVRWYLTNLAFQEYVININVVISLSVLFITTFFVLKALYQPALFTGIDINLNSSKSMLVAESNQVDTKNDTAKKEEVKRLNLFMETKKPYLDDELTLQKLAAQIEMPERQLSILINQCLGKHFFDFVNEYRIEAAKKMLIETTSKEYTVQQILYAVGFSSKSSFYTAFKKVTKQTPSAFRKTMQEK